MARTAAQRAWTLFQAMLDLYTRAGGQLLSKEEMLTRFDVCTACEYFNGRGCNLCGCCTNKRKNLFNKLAYPTEACPDGRWPAKV